MAAPTTYIEDTDVIITWKAAQSSTNVEILDYQAYVKKSDGDMHKERRCSVRGTKTECKIPIEELLKSPYNLTCGDQVNATVIAKNKYGWGWRMNYGG